METMNNFSERRVFLQKRATKYKTAAEGEVVILKGNVQRIGKLAAISGMALLGGYLLYKIFFGKKHIEPLVINTEAGLNQGIVVQRVESENNGIFQSIKQQIALFLISIAKQKLMDYLNNYKAKSTNN